MYARINITPPGIFLGHIKFVVGAAPPKDTDTVRKLKYLNVVTLDAKYHILCFWVEGSAVRTLERLDLISAGGLLCICLFF